MDQERVGELLRGALPTEGAVRQAEIVALGQVTDTLNRMGQFMQAMAEEQKALTGKIADMHTDISVIKVEIRQSEILRGEVKELKAKVEAIELLHAQQLGAGKLLTWMKEFGPWLLAMLIAAWGLFDRAPKP